MAKTVRRLYNELKPSHYDLHVSPDRQKLNFTGEVKIRLKKTGRPSQRLTFHQHGLKITDAKIQKLDKKNPHELKVTRINNQNSFDEVRLHTEEMVYSGDYEITMLFNGKITRGMTGLYPCYFKDGKKEKVLLATQFESHHARELFPCIDEPEAKATFDLSLTTEPGLTVLGNTPVKQSATNKNKSVTVIFETTPRMSSYLLAFVIGEMHSKSTKTKNGTEVSVWATVAQPADSLDFSLDVAKRSIEFFEDYFGVPYPLAKADHVALPDFSSGAMENWGLITYRERLLVVYPGESSQSIKEVIATVITHETSHQWFGNLVTMRWWNDLWLNESFANMMEYQAVDAMFPEWNIWDSFIMQEGLAALRRDATPGVQAVKTEVRHPDEINTLFDPSIVYAKGGRLLYMLKTFVGEEAFRKGLTQYFNDHAYKNTTGDDLWKALSQSSGQNIGNFMNPWLEKSGFPLISVSQKNKDVIIRQEHFLENGEKSDGRIWPVPLFTGNADVPARLDKTELSVRLTDETPLYINRGSAGHYIVNYTETHHRDYIVDLVKNQELGPRERLMLLNDASMLSKAGYQAFGDVLNLLEAYKSETTEAVWDIMALIVAESRRFIHHNDKIEENIKLFIRGLIAHEYKRLGWLAKKDEPSADTKLRALIIGLGDYSDEPAILKKAAQLFVKYKNSGDSLLPELRSIVFGSAIKQKLPGAFDFLLKLHDETTNGDLQADIAAALTITRDKKEAEILLSRLKNATVIKPQDADRWLVYLLRSRHMRDLAWQWMEDNWSWIKDIYSHDKSYDNFPRYAASACNTKAQAKQYNDFFESKTDEISLKRNILIGQSEIDTRVKWLTRDLTSVEQFFDKK